MKIAFYAPMKPPDHPVPSGDRTIARGLIQALIRRGHEVEVMSRLLTRYAWLRPVTFLKFCLELHLSRRQAARYRPDLWLTYHTYYKAPDLLGPAVSRRLGIPYFIVEGSHAPRRGKSLLTRPGFLYNRRALLTAAHVFANKKADLPELHGLLPDDRISYIPPGIDTLAFRRMPEEGDHLRMTLGIPPSAVVVCTAAMLRPGRKAEGVRTVIDALGNLRRHGITAHLLVAGDGPGAPALRRLAAAKMDGAAHFLGRLSHDQMAGAYSASDLFAFPGIRESLGMVYLEAQAAGLPVLAYRNGGVAEAVQDGITGMITHLYDEEAYTAALERLIRDENFRARLGKAAVRFVEERRNIKEAVRAMEEVFSRRLEQRNQP
ncbi:MAG: glycosyltransferase family 4 protein [Deltaproteobacteria bacterium]|nr:glycosyltransferase family 4 protein [Deltaproteobacteria bacterium]